jgi:N-acetylneuraminate synthase
LSLKELRGKVQNIVNDLCDIIKKSNVVLPSYLDIEISHHYGIDKFREIVGILLNIINRNYTKMLVIMFPGQAYPRHFHLQKDESYHILYGDLEIEVNNEKRFLKKGEIISINKGQLHSFRTQSGVIIEENSTTYIPGDSRYEDGNINATADRKTMLTIWPELIAN